MNRTTSNCAAFKTAWVQRFFSRQLLHAARITVAVLSTLFFISPVQGDNADSDLETALYMADVLRAARSEIASQQPNINNELLGDKGLSGSVLIERTLARLKEAGKPDPLQFPPDSRAGKIINAQLSAMEEIIDENQALINQQGVGFVINDVLDFSKIEAGKFDLDSRAIDLRECIEGALDLVTASADVKKLNLAYLIERDTPEGVEADGGRLRQILLNLLNNAIKFTERGEILLKVSLAENTEKPDLSKMDSTNQTALTGLHFSISDTGIGIPEDKIPFLFDSFSQVDASTTRVYGGTGLGLAISKNLVQLMGGRIWVDSVLGEGTTFNFTTYFPATRIDRRVELHETKPDLASKRLLIVDDNLTNRKILAAQSEEWSMISEQTESPVEALNWIKHGRKFDIAILDMSMPVMDGIDLARSIRKTYSPAELPLILLSSLATLSDVPKSEIEEAGFTAKLAKPIKPSALLDVMLDTLADSAKTFEKRQVKTDDQYDKSMAVDFPLSILLVDDNKTNQKLASLVLKRLGYVATVAVNGKDAVEKQAEGHFDVILMDIEMPVMDGIDATRNIRKLEGDRASAAYIVAVTANAMQGDRERYLAAGMDAYVSKPMRINELVNALKTAKLSALNAG